jgi:hypothetical protein
VYSHILRAMALPDGHKPAPRRKDRSEGRRRKGKRLAASRKAATEDPAAWLGLSVVLVTPSAARQPGDGNVTRVVAFGRYNPIRNWFILFPRSICLTSVVVPIALHYNGSWAIG